MPHLSGFGCLTICSDYAVAPAKVFVQRLGYVMITDSGWTPGQSNRSTYGRCRYSLPSTPNNDPAYLDNSYWRGRVWGPLNYLVCVLLFSFDPSITKVVTNQSLT